MKPAFPLGLALLLVCPAWAQTPVPPVPSVTPRAAGSITDPGAAVPASRYRSVFTDTPTGVETASEDWKKANADVGQFRNGFVDVLRWEAAQPAGRDLRTPASPSPLAPQVAPEGHRHAH